MKRLSHHALIVCLSAFATGSHAQLILDTFDVDTSANYTVRDDGNATSGDGTPDSVINFAFDYSGVGIPSAPRSTGGTTLGLFMAVNETANDAGAADHITAFNNLAVTGSYRVTVDLYMAVELGQPGSTEFATVGLASDGADFNSIFTPIAGSGHFLSVTGEGGSSSDFRHFVSGTPVNDGDASYLNSTNTTNATGDTYLTIFAGGDFPGSPGNRWTTLTIDVIEGGNVTYAFDGTPIIQTPTDTTTGLIGLGYTDAFSSVGPHFVVFDNLEVAVIPEPAAVLLATLGLPLLLLRRRR